MLIDANIFLEVILEQEKAEQCKLFLRDVLSGRKQAFISTFAIDSVVLTILRKYPDKNKARIFLINLLKYEGLKFYQIKVKDRINCLQLIEKYNLDYEDAIVLQSALSTGCKEIISFDTDFDNIKEIKRVEP